MSRARAAFLDRDGTLVEDSGYLRDVEAMRLFPGAAEAVARLHQAGWLPIVVTNQSGIARGLLSHSEYLATERRLEQLLGVHGARLAAQYHCPHLPEISGACECRKPGTLLYREAAERLGIDLAASYWIGDRLRDLEPARQFGGRGILVLTGAGAGEANAAKAGGWALARNLEAAVGIVMESEG